MHILFTGGGSGGHILPNLALCRRLKKEHPECQLSYIGEKDSMEESMMKEERIPFYTIHAGKMRRYISLRNLLDLFVIPYGILESLWHVLRLRPDVVFSKGGYVSFPVVVASWILRKKILIHESDVVPGLTTKLSSHFASTICISWERTKSFFSNKHVVLTGIPVREELRDGDREKGRAFCGMEKNALPTLLVIGGSLGAGAINCFVHAHLPTLLESYNVVHIVGKGKMEQVDLPTHPKRYAQLEFIQEELPDVLALSDVILSRAGSTFLAECAFLQKPLIMVPLPLTQSRGDQFDNAEEYIKLWPGRGILLREEEMEVEKLKNMLHSLATMEHTASEGNTAVEKIVELLGA